MFARTDFLRAGLAMLALLQSGSFAIAQEMKVQPTPFSVWLNFDAVRNRDHPRMGLPIWMESVVSTTTRAGNGTPQKTSFRLRLRHFGDLNKAFQLRLFFTDKPDARPVVSGWTETGIRVFAPPPLGDGLNLPTSAALTVPAAEIDYVDIEVPGDGSTVRGAFLASLGKRETQHALDFGPRSTIEDPFGQPVLAPPSPDDTFLYGRVRATVDPGVLKLTPPELVRADYQFELDARPQLAVCTFEVLNADLTAPLMLWVNDQWIGPVSLQVPDLADPGYEGGRHYPGREAPFHYQGWLRAQAIIRGSMFVEGLNKIILGLDPSSGPVAIRAVELQLKHPVTNSNR